MIWHFALFVQLVSSFTAASRPNLQVETENGVNDKAREELCHFCQRVMILSPAIGIEWSLFPPYPWPNLMKSFACNFKGKVHVDKDAPKSTCDGIDPEDTHLLNTCRKTDEKRQQAMKDVEHKYPSSLLYVIFQCGGCAMCSVKRWMHKKFESLSRLFGKVKKAFGNAKKSFWGMLGYPALSKTEQQKQHEFIRSRVGSSSFLGLERSDDFSQIGPMPWDSSEDQLCGQIQAALELRHRNFTHAERFRDISLIQSRMEETLQSGVLERLLSNASFLAIDRLSTKILEQGNKHKSPFKTHACQKTLVDDVDRNWQIVANLEFPDLFKATVFAMTGNIVGVIEALLPELLVAVTPSRTVFVEKNPAMRACLRDADQREGSCGDERNIFSCRARALQQIAIKAARGHWINGKTEAHAKSTEDMFKKASKGVCIDPEFHVPKNASGEEEDPDLKSCHDLAKQIDADLDVEEDSAGQALRIWTAFMKSADVDLSYANLGKQCSAMNAWVTAYCAGQSECIRDDMPNAWFEEDDKDTQGDKIQDQEDAIDPVQRVSSVIDATYEDWDDKWSEVWKTVYRSSRADEFALWEDAQSALSDFKTSPNWKASLDVWQKVSDFVDDSYRRRVDDSLRLQSPYDQLQQLYRTQICA
eukprot:TRINITY_DN29142_c0_g2_i1.p1 TRINITY_DN29142_c0_g2~~TRINITY_DN29142_c0_g2_i1.p1  ORF type:complete len:644 (-),score=75.31 TRINITY_DN29142_c0_g2_i1:112-2043(-)